MCCVAVLAAAAEGGLLTTGWNKYGQLALGDCRSRDRFTPASYFPQHRLRARHVQCASWTTVVFAEATRDTEEH